MALTGRARIGQEEMDRIIASAGYPNDEPEFLNVVEDMAIGLQEICQKRRNDTMDRWGYCAHYKNFAVTMRTLMQSAGW